MTNPAPGAASNNNTKIIEEFRANRGRVGGMWAGTTLILIHHIGAKSGTERVTPVGCFLQPDGRFVIVASNGGAAAHPAWYYNLKANPRINVEFGTGTFAVAVRELEGAEREKVWADAASAAPGLGEYQNKTTRTIPVLLLTRISTQRRVVFYETGTIMDSETTIGVPVTMGPSAPLVRQPPIAS
jgi:deazaflavin-dependent oxidoreductase (nitroreductase family)